MRPRPPIMAGDSAAPSQSSPQRSRKRTNFSDLPIELRRQIWDLVCAPRILSVVPHYGSTSMDSNHPAHCLPFVKYHPFHFCCVTFTVAEGLHPELQAVPYWAEKPFYNELNDKFKKEYKNARARPKPPVALFICSESRQFALERYDLAFPSHAKLKTNLIFTKMFVDGEFHEPKVWVDWKRDTIFIVRADESLFDFRDMAGEKLHIEILSKYAPEDVPKIQKLAVAGHWNNSTPDHPHSKLKRALVEHLDKFEDVKELLVYQMDLDKVAAAYAAERTRPDVVFRSDKSTGEVRGEVEEALREKREVDGRKGQGLVVSISRDLQWGWSFGGEDLGWTLDGVPLR